MGSPPNPMNTPLDTPVHRRRWPWLIGVLVIGGALAAWWWLGSSRNQEAQGARRPPGATPVITAKAETRDVPVRIKVNGTVTALQSVDLRSQVTSTVREVHIREGQNVRGGDLLFTLDARTDEANLKKALAQVEKDRADLATAQRNLARQRELFQQKFISQAALDTVQNQVDTLTGQIAIDQAAVEGARVARAYNEIRAPFTGRTGTIAVRAGSLVQPGATAVPLVTVTQIDPIAVAFTLPERELAGLQQALSAGSVPVTVSPTAGGDRYQGKVTFVDNAVDTTTGTIRVKAEFANPKSSLWPGMYVSVDMSARTLANATVVPAQAVQTGPDNRFIYVVGDDGKVALRPVQLGYLAEGVAVVDGIPAGARIVVEGAQNLRPGSSVVEADRSSPDGDGKGGGEKKGEGRKKKP
jgi:RND family efflux transporter MFP subunit